MQEAAIGALCPLQLVEARHARLALQKRDHALELAQGGVVVAAAGLQDAEVPLHYGLQELSLLCRVQRRLEARKDQPDVRRGARASRASRGSRHGSRWELAPHGHRGRPSNRRTDDAWTGCLALLHFTGGIVRTGQAGSVRELPHAYEVARPVVQGLELHVEELQVQVVAEAVAHTHVEGLLRGHELLEGDALEGPGATVQEHTRQLGRVLHQAEGLVQLNHHLAESVKQGAHGRELLALGAALHGLAHLHHLGGEYEAADVHNEEAVPGLEHDEAVPGDGQMPGPFVQEVCVASQG
mmetsp:Transcript_24799/g.68076  ORF Transcript_24799/g.68076 Transcript_24799/m.68076 type:complete len:297 (+) Transcript_24799:333-1223(+)